MDSGRPMEPRIICGFRSPVLKTAESSEMPFGMRTRVGQKKHVLDWSTRWRQLANTNELSVCGDDAS